MHTIYNSSRKCVWLQIRLNSRNAVDPSVEVTPHETMQICNKCKFTVELKNLNAIGKDRSTLMTSLLIFWFKQWRHRSESFYWSLMGHNKICIIECNLFLFFRKRCWNIFFYTFNDVAIQILNNDFTLVVSETLVFEKRNMYKEPERFANLINIKIWYSVHLCIINQCNK